MAFFGQFPSIVNFSLYFVGLRQAGAIYLNKQYDKSYFLYNFVKKSMSTAPNVTFGYKSGTTAYVSNPQASIGGQPLASYINPNPAYVYNTNQVIGQPSPLPPPPITTTYYDPPSVDWRNTGGAVTINQQSTQPQQARENRLSDEVQRPQFSKGGQSAQPTKKLGPDSDPQKSGELCHPGWWILGGIIALALLTLALLFGLGVIGGSGNNSSSAVSSTGGSAVPVSPSGTTGTTTSGTTGTSTSGTGSTSTSTTTGGKVGGASGNTSGSTSGTPSGTTSGTPSGSTSGTTPGKTSGTTSGTNSGTNSGTTSGTASGTTSGTASGVTGVSPIPYSGSSTSTATAQPTTTTSTAQPAVKPASIPPVVVQPISVPPVPASAA